MAQTDALRAAVRDVADFPKAGILFKDITPILSDGILLRTAIDCFVADCAGQDIRKIGY
jgi:adenine phosphoribosyltransferase